MMSLHLQPQLTCKAPLEAPLGRSPPTPRATRYEPWRLMTAPPDSCTNSSPVTATLSPLRLSLLLHVASFPLFAIYHSHRSRHAQAARVWDCVHPAARGTLEGSLMQEWCETLWDHTWKQPSRLRRLTKTLKTPEHSL